jgi:hypothetical protein
MPLSCSVCSGNLAESPDSMILCLHKQGAVHLGCCIHDCSQSHEPCDHAKAFYDKVSLLR